MKAHTTPPTPRTALGVIGWSMLGILAVVYLVNPTAGVFELLPDNLPLLGNLDEATATLFVLSALKYLTGVDLTGRPRAMLGAPRTEK